MLDPDEDEGDAVLPFAGACEVEDCVWVEGVDAPDATEDVVPQPTSAAAVNAPSNGIRIRCFFTGRTSTNKIFLGNYYYLTIIKINIKTE